MAELCGRIVPLFRQGVFENHIQSVALKQSGHRYFSQSVEVLSDNEIHVNFGDLSTKLTPNVPVDLYFYGEDGATVEQYGVPSLGGRLHWRTVRTGTCVTALPQIVSYLNSGSGKDGTWQSGDTIKVSGKNILYPVPTATKLLLKGQDGSLYVFENPRLPDDWYTHHYDNDNMVLYFTVPDDLSSARVSGGTGTSGTTELGGGLVVASAGALATTAVSDGALAVLASNPAGLAVIGSTVTGLSIYAGVENTRWLVKKIEMALAKRSTTEMTKPGNSGDDQPADPSHLVFVAYEVARAGDLRTRYIVGTYVRMTAYEAVSPAGVERIKRYIGVLELISPLQVTIQGEQYWEYGNATITRMIDYASTPPPLTVAYSVCEPWGWSLGALGDLHVDSVSSGTLRWKTNTYFGYDQSIDETDFNCSREYKQIEPYGDYYVRY